jgi:hypothetical protein
MDARLFSREIPAEVTIETVLVRELFLAPGSLTIMGVGD